MKSINTVAGTGNPVKITDLATLWENINMCLIGRTGNTATIISGCEYDGSEMKEGIIFFKNIAYTLFDPVPDGYYIYAQSVQDENRTYEDGTVHQFYYNNVINSSDSGTETTLGTLIGIVSYDTVNEWTWTRVAADSITNEMLTQGCVHANNISNGSVTALKLGDNSVITSKIASKTISGDKIANGAVGTTQLANGSVTTDILSDNAITIPKLSAQSIIDSKIVTQTILNRSLSTGCVDSRVLAAGAVEESNIADFSVSQFKLMDSAVGTDQIMDQAVTAAKIASKTITGSQIANNAIVTSNLDEECVLGGIGGSIERESITDYNLASNCVKTPKISDNAVTTEKLASYAVTKAKIHPTALIPVADVLEYDLSDTPTVNVSSVNQILIFTGNPSNTTVEIDPILNFISFAGSKNIYYFNPTLSTNEFVDIYVFGQKVITLTGPSNKPVRVTQVFYTDGPSSSCYLDVELIDYFYKKN